MLMRSAAQSLTEQLAERFAARIRDRLLAPGSRLPSVRQCATQHQLSPSTVVAAYDQLLAQGLIEARPQRGFFVRDWTPKSALPSADGSLSAIDTGVSRRPAGLEGLAAPIKATALIRGMFHPTGSKPQPGMGVFPPDWLATNFMTAAVRKVTGSAALQESSLKYGEPLGDSDLRRVLSARLMGIGLPADPAQIITTLGATHALDIVSRTLLKAGDCVMVEEPGWAVEFARLDALGMRILPVPRGPAGPDIEVMARYCEVHAPKLFVSVSVLHNPTGHSLTPGSAHRVLQLAGQFGFHVVEDDTYSHIAPEHATRMSVLDGLQRTIYVSGFAKILAPNWRIGFLAAPPDLVERLLRHHAERIRTRLDAARSRSVKLALQAGCTFAAEPAGLFGWVETGVDTDQLAQRMLDEGYLLAPGALFHAARAPTTLMRINFATTQDAAFWAVLTKQIAAMSR